MGGGGRLAVKHIWLLTTVIVYIEHFLDFVAVYIFCFFIQIHFIKGLFSKLAKKLVTKYGHWRGITLLTTASRVKSGIILNRIKLH